MFAYRYDRKIDDLVKTVKAARPEYDFIDVDEVRHRFWIIDEPETIAAIIRAFAGVPRNLRGRRDITELPPPLQSARNWTSKAGAMAPDTRHKYFLAVHFPDNQLEILDYNRLVADLNGLDPDVFLQALAASFIVEKTGSQAIRPKQCGETGMYLAGAWYRLIVRPEQYAAADVMAALGVSILSDLILQPILDVHDQRTDPRIAFVGGARGSGELQDRVDSGEMAVAFTLCPVSVQDLMTIADAGEIMPPQSHLVRTKIAQRPGRVQLERLIHDGRIAK